jgi:hypothetical protein
MGTNDANEVALAGFCGRATAENSPHSTMRTRRMTTTRSHAEVVDFRIPVSCRARSSLRSFRICACIVRSKAWSSFAMVTSRVPSEASGEGAEGESAA